MAIKFQLDQVYSRIRFENPWWEQGSIDSYYEGLTRRKYFHLLFPHIIQRSIKRALILMGPRRVGKTVLLYQSIQQLIDDGVPPHKINYFSIETPLFNGISLEELVNISLKLNKLSTDDELYFFFDEIQYLKDWERHLKSLVDSYHNFKFIVSGSAAAALKLLSQESGAGRFTEFALPPLTFHEYLFLTGHDNLFEEVREVKEGSDATVLNMKVINQKFIEYINYGGYPELSLSEEMKTNPGRYIRNDIIDKVLLRDLPSLYGINDIQELNALFTYLAYHSGDELSLDELSQNSGVAKNTIKKYITYLEAAFLIKVIHRVDHNAKKFKRANFYKIYLTNCSIRSALFSPLEPTDNAMGNMVETAVFSQWHHNQNKPLFYARWKSGEVDMVSLSQMAQQKPEWCIELKWSNRYATKPKELKSLISFCKKNNLTKTKVTTIDLFRTIEVDGIVIEFEPASYYCYKVGKNIVDQDLY